MVIHETSWTVEITTGPERSLLLCVVTKGLEADVEQTAPITDEQARWLAHDLTAEKAGCCQSPARIYHQSGWMHDWVVVEDHEKWLLSGSLNHENRGKLARDLYAQIEQARILRGIESPLVAAIRDSLRRPVGE